jgi:hypothetical protein
MRSCGASASTPDAALGTLTGCFTTIMSLRRLRGPDLRAPARLGDEELDHPAGFGRKDRNFHFHGLQNHDRIRPTASSPACATIFRPCGDLGSEGLRGHGNSVDSLIVDTANVRIH